MGNPFGVGTVQLIEGRMPDSGLPVYLVDCPILYDREGGPYQQNSGQDWPDNPARFALLSQIAARMANKAEGGDWNPDLLHVNDWQCGLAPAYLRYYGIKGVKSVYTIHNLRYQGIFDPAVMQVIALPEEAFSLDGIEFHGAVSYMKAGLQFADAITTVSRTYAKEIQTAEFGYGIEGLLQARADDLVGIVNGIDYDLWDPQRDPLIEQTYGIDTLEAKRWNKMALQWQMGLPVDEEAPLLGFVGRLTEQKGVDLIVDKLPQIRALGAQLILIGTGEAQYEQQLAAAAAGDEGIRVEIAYNEEQAHRIIAGSDMFLMPSRFEPCGLTQMYALRYGTLPIVRRTGGLSDTVIDATAGQSGDGFVFSAADSVALLEAIERAVIVHRDRKTWRMLQKRAMTKDFSWERSARDYIALYEKLGVALN
jgi:starch synthase